MLSIIISSYQPDLFNKIEKNIAETIGISYEIIKIENPGLMGICAAYNLGAEKAVYSKLLFLHEDVRFLKNNWGEFLLQYITQEKIGVVGVAGGNYVPYCPSGWWVEGYKTINIFQSHKNLENKEIINLNQQNNNFAKGVDGVFLACRKDIYNQFKFNEKLNGFHGYDIDFSIRVSEKYQNIILHDTILEHFSKGNLSPEWFKAIIEARKNYKSSKIVDKKAEKEKLYDFFNYCRMYNLPKYKTLKLGVKYTNIKKLGFINFIKSLKRLAIILTK